MHTIPLQSLSNLSKLHRAFLIQRKYEQHMTRGLLEESNATQSFTDLLKRAFCYTII